MKLAWFLTTMLLLSCSEAATTSQAGDAGGDSPNMLDSQDIATQSPCNGDPALCALPINQVTLPTTHNGMSSKADGFLLPNQPDGLLAQLDSGIRGFMLDVHPYDGNIATEQGKPYLCHANCKLGASEFTGAMAALRKWLDAHPREFVVIIFEDYVPETAIDAGLQAAGLLPHCLHLGPSDATPTLAEVIAKDTRLLIMTESGGGALAWNHGYQDLAFDTPYSFETAANFNCDVLRGKPGNRFFVVNHFLTHNLEPHDTLAKLVNHNPLLLERAQQCQKQQGQRVGLLAVDWYTEGDLLSAVATLNGL